MSDLLNPNNDVVSYFEQSKSNYNIYGWPTSKEENYKFTPLNKIFKNDNLQKTNKSFFKFIDLENNSNITALDNSCLRIFENKFFTNNKMTDVSLGNFTDGFIYKNNRNSFTKNVFTIEQIIDKNIWSSSVMMFNISDSSKFDCILNIELSDNSISTPIIIINMDKNSNASFGITISNNSSNQENGKNVGLIHSNLSSDSILEISLSQHGNILCRNDINVDLNGENCKFNLNGIYLGKNNHHNDITTSINHLKENTFSFQNIRGILDNKSKGVFQGGIYVDKIAQKTDGQQLSKTLMLSKLAEINTKPELKIYADDVSCSHGNTIGDIDRDQLFYLLSRGIDEKLARKILVEAFLSETVEEIENEKIKLFINESLNKWFSGLS